jgi:hypothetical protein
MRQSASVAKGDHAAEAAWPPSPSTAGGLAVSWSLSTTTRGTSCPNMSASITKCRLLHCGYFYQALSAIVRFTIPVCRLPTFHNSSIARSRITTARETTPMTNGISWPVVRAVFTPGSVKICYSKAPFWPINSTQKAAHAAGTDWAPSCTGTIAASWSPCGGSLAASWPFS